VTGDERSEAQDWWTTGQEQQPSSLLKQSIPTVQVESPSGISTPESASASSLLRQSTPTIQVESPSGISTPESTSTSVAISEAVPSAAATVPPTEPNWKEVNIRGRAVRHLAFLPQQLTRAARQPQHKEEAEDASIVESKATRRCNAQRKQPNNSHFPTP
jgi:hypothetical protein